MDWQAFIEQLQADTSITASNVLLALSRYTLQTYGTDDVTLLGGLLEDPDVSAAFAAKAQAKADLEAALGDATIAVQVAVGKVVEVLRPVQPSPVEPAPVEVAPVESPPAEPIVEG